MTTLEAPQKIVILGGSGHLGRIMTSHFVAAGHRVTIVGRGSLPASMMGPNVDFARWDGRTVEAHWASEVDGADVVLNLAGRTVDCRYNKVNLEQMLSSRIDSTRAVGEAIAQAQSPPRVWLQMSTATIYAHTYGPANDERTGQIGAYEPGTPDYWRYSVLIAEAWEEALWKAQTPHTRRVALRSAMVMSGEPGGPFRVLARLARAGLGGAVAGGDMYMSWIHDADFARALDLLIANEEVSGPVNLAAPGPVPQKQFMAGIREAQREIGGLRIPLALPLYRWMVNLGAVFLRTDPELILKSRRAVSVVLPEHGFQFEFTEWPVAALDLVQQSTKHSDSLSTE